MTLQLKAAKRVLLAAGYDESEISELVRGIKADAWDKGYKDAGEDFEWDEFGCIQSDIDRLHHDTPTPNPYRTPPPNYTEGAAK